MSERISAPAKQLFKQITSSNRHRPDELLAFLVDDVLAGFGRPPDSPPPKEALTTIREMGKRYAECVIATAPFEDVLGTLYMELASTSGKRWLGQYFTPQPVADMMALMLLGNEDHAPREDGSLWKTCDPCCGSGVMLLAMARAIANNGGGAGLRNCSFTGVDIDSLVARIAAVQMMANALIHQVQLGELLVLHGNSLTAQEMKVVIHATRRDLDSSKVAPAICEPRMQAIREAARASGVQLGLFEEETATPEKRRRAFSKNNGANGSASLMETATQSLFD